MECDLAGECRREAFASRSRPPDAPDRCRARAPDAGRRLLRPPAQPQQLVDGAYLIGGGWPARVPDEAVNRWEVLDDSVRGSLEVARAVYPPLAARSVARSWAGIEAFTPDDLPLLGAMPGLDGLLIAAGFSGHGFALVPAVGDVLARLALGLNPLPGLWRGLGAARLP